MLFRFVLTALIGMVAVPVVLATDGTVACDPSLRPVEISESGTVFTSLNYNGTAPYPPNQLCEYKFIGSVGQNVILTFDDIVLEECTDCNCDYIEVYDGPDDTSNLLTKMCGNVNTPVALASGADGFVRFVSDESTQGTGFSATFTVGNAACEGGVVLTEINGTFVSPNFPLNYGNSEDCTWTLKVPEDSYRVDVWFDSFEVEDRCMSDYVKMVDSTGNVLQTWWWEEGPQDPNVIFSSRSGQGDIDITFTSDSSVTRNGFRGYWRMGRYLPGTVPSRDI
ncbi:hypothetical protein LSH36_24g06044 [Paralvinella palmiformis]|uniref:CUB domain-containing protein n=1 Tax=Paralvinella palmiformis TaxID=53620 RepID=A0AAD9NGU7_9ANNE|nr:hypothetical protein LSH36_24g06044 [Paralvinella palmiformis]